MNLHGFDVNLPADWRATVIHEFGHALGFEHEHQSPEGDCDFRFEDDPGYIPTQNQRGWFIPDRKGRRPGLYTYLGGPENNWSRERVDFNLRQLETSSAYATGSFDRASIMLYTFDPFMFRRGEQSPCYVAAENTVLSAQDRVGAARIYRAAPEAIARSAAESDAILRSLAKVEPASSAFRLSIESHRQAVEKQAK